jgi:hypothetical protein
LPDYQVRRWLHGAFLRGLDEDETRALTLALLDSGKRFDWSGLGRPSADKHSTGGVGDKISLPLAPIVAACDVLVPMVSGRGLGHTGGTLDKLEAMPGFKTTLAPDALRGQLDRIGVFMVGQGPDLAPADGKLYALRDVTSTGRVRAVHRVEHRQQEDRRGCGRARLRREVRRWRVHARTLARSRARGAPRARDARARRAGVGVRDRHEPAAR